MPHAFSGPYEIVRFQFVSLVFDFFIFYLSSGHVIRMVYKKNRPYVFTLFMKVSGTAGLKNRVALKCKSYKRQKEDTVSSRYGAVNYFH